MKLLFAIKSINGEGGGAERVLVDICNGLAARGHQVVILTFDPPDGDSFYALDAAITRMDAAICIPGKPVPRFSLFLAMPRLRRLIDSVDADLIIPFMHSIYIPLAVALLGMNKKIVASEHTDFAHYRSRKLQGFLATAIEYLIKTKTVPSLPVLREYPAWRRGHIHVLPNPIDLNQYSRSKAPTAPPHLLSVGRLDEEKNHIDLIRAFAQVSPDFPEWTLRIIGEGELREFLEAEIVRLGIQSRVTLPGVSRDVAAAYAAASVVVLPSLYESFGLVAAEALASERPVLSFDNCLGIAEMVKNEKNGILVSGGGGSAKRVSNLAEGLARLMDDSELRVNLGHKGPASVQQYALQNVVDSWERFLLSLV